MIVCNCRTGFFDAIEEELNILFCIVSLDDHAGQAGEFPGTDVGREIGTEPGDIIPAFEMTGGFLTMEIAIGGRITRDLPIDNRQGAGDEEITEQVLFSY